jgi:hypothetical protein
MGTDGMGPHGPLGFARDAETPGSPAPGGRPRREAPEPSGPKPAGDDRRRSPAAGAVRVLRHAVRRVWRSLASQPAQLAFRITRSAPVAAHLNRRLAAAQARHPALPSLTPAEAAVVEGLERQGVFAIHMDALGLTDASPSGILAEGSRVAELIATRAAGAWRPAVLAATPEDLIAYPEVYRWGLNATLLRIAEAYLRLPVGYDGPRVFNTIGDGRESASRLWHLDREDMRLIKVALYLHDVGEDRGPFQLLPYDAHRDGPPRGYPALETAELERLLGVKVDDHSVITNTGRAGTLVFAETGRFYHRGKPATALDRSAIFYSYFARPPRHPFFCDRSRLSQGQIRGLVSDLSAEQRAAALWRESVAWPARWVPVSKM